MDTIESQLINLQKFLSQTFETVIAHADENNAELSRNFDDVERFIVEQVKTIGLGLMDTFFTALGQGDLGPSIICNEATFKRKHKSRPTSILTFFGKLTYSRSLYYDGNGNSIEPLRKMAHLPEANISYLAQEVMQRLALDKTYQESQEFFKDVWGYSTSSRTIEQVVMDSSCSYQDYIDEDIPMQKEAVGGVMVVSADGKGVSVKKDEQTTGKTREALVGCVYSVMPEVRDPQDLANLLTMPYVLTEEQKMNLQKQYKTENIQYTAGIERSKNMIFNELKEISDVRKEVIQPIKTVCLIDGAPKLWSLAKEYFPDAVYALDIMHVIGYLELAVNALVKKKDERTVVISSYLELMLTGKLTTVLKSLRTRKALNKLKKSSIKDVEKALTYFENHKDYMKYDEYLRDGLPIATGVIESACKHIIKSRMDRAGAQWSIKGADAMLQLRCIKASGHWQEFTELRQKSEYDRQYSHLDIKAA